MPRFALSEPSIGSTTTSVELPSTNPDLLGDDRDAERPEAREDDALGGLVDRGRLVAAAAAADHRLPLDARRQVGEHAAHVLGGGTAEGEPVSQGDGRAART